MSGPTPAPAGIRVEPVPAADRAAVAAIIASLWHGEDVVVHDDVFRLADLPTLVAREDGKIVGAATYRLAGDRAELVSLNSLRPGAGIGSALVAAAEAVAADAGCALVELTTTNDNVDALGFYQRRGYRMVAIDRGAVDRARRLKPEIPETGLHGLPLRDEIRLEKPLTVR